MHNTKYLYLFLKNNTNLKACNLKDHYTYVENEYGGLSRRIKIGKFIFDRFPHFSF